MQRDQRVQVVSAPWSQMGSPGTMGRKLGRVKWRMSYQADLEEGHGRWWEKHEQEPRILSE